MKTFNQFLSEEGEGCACGCEGGESCACGQGTSDKPVGELGHLDLPMGQIARRSAPLLADLKKKKKKKKKLVTEAEEKTIEDKQKDLEVEKAEVEKIIKSIDAIKTAITNVGVIPAGIMTKINSIKDASNISWLFDPDKASPITDVLGDITNVLSQYLRSPQESEE